VTAFEAGNEELDADDAGPEGAVVEAAVGAAVDVAADAVDGAVDGDEDAAVVPEKALVVGVGVADADVAEDECEGAEGVVVADDDLVHVGRIVGVERVGAVADESGVEPRPAPRDLEAAVRVADQEKDKDCQQGVVEAGDVEDTFGEPYIVVGMRHKSGVRRVPHGDVCDLE
jgi:hypothetical protein